MSCFMLDQGVTGISVVLAIENPGPSWFTYCVCAMVLATVMMIAGVTKRPFTTVDLDGTYQFPPFARLSLALLRVTSPAVWLSLGLWGSVSLKIDTSLSSAWLSMGICCVFCSALLVIEDIFFGECIG
ncbi:hypothetical protein F5Y16DRAFT_358609 [Xylariaceae sp. FL0255]|nr:hypothetical protein F5Y16DRAFT_358609 [Xylariaceae sp. FL0255]